MDQGNRFRSVHPSTCPLPVLQATKRRFKTPLASSQPPAGRGLSIEICMQRYSIAEGNQHGVSRSELAAAEPALLD
jgi:hypothetical protein